VSYNARSRVYYVKARLKREFLRAGIRMQFCQHGNETKMPTTAQNDVWDIQWVDDLSHVMCNSISSAYWWWDIQRLVTGFSTGAVKTENKKGQTNYAIIIMNKKIFPDSIITFITNCVVVDFAMAVAILATLKIIDWLVGWLVGWLVEQTQTWTFLITKNLKASSKRGVVQNLAHNE